MLRSAARGPAPHLIGGFQRRVYGAGATLDRQVGISGCWYHEMGAESRLEGDIGFVTLTLEL